MADRMVFTKPLRAKLAKQVAAIVYLRTGISLDFTEGTMPNELGASYPVNVVTVNGPIEWVRFNIDENGLNIYVCFTDPAVAKKNCPGINEMNGKWNHYIWPSKKISKENRIAYVTAHLVPILKNILPEGRSFDIDSSPLD